MAEAVSESTVSSRRSERRQQSAAKIRRRKRLFQGSSSLMTPRFVGSCYARASRRLPPPKGRG